MQSKSAAYLLLAGTLLGVALAAFAIIEAGDEREAALGDSVIAEVNGTLIAREVYDTQVERLASDKKNPMTNDDRAHVLERMIEEELLIQRGVEVGLVMRNRPVRAALVQAMINAIIADTRAMEIPDSDLQDFYQENAAYFVRSAHLHVAVLRFASLERAEAARAALYAGTAYEEVERQYAEPTVLEVPATLLPAAKLREYIGPSLLKTALKLKVGELSAVQQTGNRFALLLLVEAEKDAPPPLLEIKETVEAEFRKRAGDEALRDYLEWLKTRADIVRLPTDKE